jgi:hypothetical protein
MSMSRVFEAMRRQNAAAPESPAAPAELLETFLVEAVPSVNATDEPSSTPPATFWSETAAPTGTPAEKLTAVERKRERMARSFGDLLREIALDEKEHGY